MAKLNSEFNYRYQVIGETVWAKIQTLQGFLNGRLRAAAMEEVAKIRYQAKLEELKHLDSIGGLPHVILNLKADILEIESHQKELEENFKLNLEEIEILRKLLKELYEIAEPTRIPGYSDEQMFEVNAANEFTMNIAKDIQTEIICYGHPSPAKLRNAMSNPHTFNALKQAGMIPKDTPLLQGNVDPNKIELIPMLPSTDQLKIST